MKAIIITQEIKDKCARYGLYETTNVGTIVTSMPRQFFVTAPVSGYYRTRTDLHEADGWRDVVQPTIGVNQRRGPIYFDEPNNVFTYEVIDLTPEEIEANKVSAAEAARQAKLQEKTIEIADQTFQEIVDAETVLANSDAYPLWRNFEDGHTFAIDFKVQDFNEEGELKVYSVIQGHDKQETWFPRNVPALFVLVQPEGATEWEAGAAYEVGDIRTFEGVEYRCIQAHTSIVGWEPPNVPNLWEVYNP